MRRVRTFLLTWCAVACGSEEKPPGAAQKRALDRNSAYCRCSLGPAQLGRDAYLRCLPEMKSMAGKASKK